MSSLKYNRVLLKLSGAELAGPGRLGIDPEVALKLCKEIISLVDAGAEVAIVIGGGNLFRGKTLSEAGLDRITGDYMGMLATVMNSLAVRELLEQEGCSTRLMSAIPVSGVVDQYDRRKAIGYLQNKKVVILAGGSGNPLVTTDYTASLRAVEIEADVLLKATGVDGVYDKDPKKHTDAKKYNAVGFKEVLDKELAVMDLSAFCQCRDHSLPIIVFNVNEPQSSLKVVKGEKIGTLVSGE